MNNKQVQQAMLRRFEAGHAAETRTPFLQAPPADTPDGGALSDAESFPRHLNQFFKLALHRKRHFLEKMLLDS